MKLIIQEVMEIIIEDHGTDNMEQSIQYIIEEAKYLQLLRSHVTFHSFLLRIGSFEKMA
jgi:hypothetical protein